MTNNELSKCIITALFTAPEKRLKFNELAKIIPVDKKRLALNLFYLEMNGFVRLHAVYTHDTLFPEIVLVSLSAKGLSLAKNDESLERHFPSKLEYGIQNISLLIEHLLEAMEEWSQSSEEKMAYFEKVREVLKDPLFSKFIEEFYSGKQW